MEIIVETPERMHELGARLAAFLDDGDVVTLTGGLGAGKTQFAQGVGEGLGVEGHLASPTYNLVFEYDGGSVRLFHFDLYRLEVPEQLEDIDFHYLADPSTPGVALVEWADMFPDEMPDDILDVRIRRVNGNEGMRELAASATGPRSEELLSQWRGCI